MGEDRCDVGGEIRRRCGGAVGELGVWVCWGVMSVGECGCGAW